MKKTKGIPFETILNRRLKDQEFRMAFDERRFYLHVARLVSDLREQVGFSQARLAKAAGISQPMIARLERGDQTRIPTFDTIYRILKALGFTLEISIKPTKQVA